MPMPTPLKPFGKKLRLKLTRLNEAAAEGRTNGPRIEGALWGKKMRRKLERLAVHPHPEIRERPPVDETVQKILWRQERSSVGPATRLAEPIKPPKRRKPAAKKPGKRG